MYVVVLGYWKSGRTSTSKKYMCDSALKPRSQARFNALSHIYEKLLEKISKNPRWSRYFYDLRFENTLYIHGVQYVRH